ncbi:MAG: radical SAM protein [Bacteroidota bacterium]
MKNKILLFYPLVNQNRQIPNLPFSILNIERVLRDLPVEVILVDERVERNVKDIINSYKDEWLVVGISAMIGYQMISGKELSEYVKQNTKAKVVWGGWFSNVLPEIALKEDFIDIVVFGQGELPFRELIISLLKDEALSDIKGIGFKQSGQIIINSKAEVHNEEEFPAINYDKVDIKKIIEVNGSNADSKRSLNYIATFGCPYNCTFCCLTTVWGQKTFSKNIDIIIDDIKLFIFKYNVTKISFDDDHFFGNKTFVLNLIQRILDEGIEFEWEANAHISYFLKSYTLEQISMFKKAGCVSIRFGAESGDQDVLNKINKKTTINDILEVVKIMKIADIKCVYYIMVAFPWNPSKDFNSTLNMLGQSKLINPDLEIGVNFFIPFPGTPIYEESKKYGFNGFKSFDDTLSVFFELFVGPWWLKNYRKELYDFIWVYFKYANPNFYKTAENRTTMAIINKIMYPFCYFRLKYNIRSFRFEPKIYFIIKRLVNLFNGSKYDDEKEQMVRCRSWKR